jgi:hypothetical protein
MEQLRTWPQFKKHRELLKLFCHYPILNLTKIREKLWEDANSQKSEFRIVKKLIELGLIERQVGDLNIILGFRLTQKGIQFAKSLFGQELIPQRATYKTTLDHDLLLSDIASLFLKNPKVIDWKAEEFVRSELGKRYGENNFREKRYKVPDGVLYWRSIDGIQQIAIELEISRKSRLRYQKMFKQILLSLDFSSSIIIFSDAKTQKVAQEELMWVLENDYQIKKHRPTTRVLFVLLKDILENAHRMNLDALGCATVSGIPSVHNKSATI